MSTKYSPQEKEKIIFFAKKFGENKASTEFGCSERSIFRWEKLYDGTIDSLDNKYCAPHTSHPKAHTEEEINNIKEVLRQNPYITNKELYNVLKKDYGYKRHPGGLYNYLRRNKIVPEPKLKNNYATMFDIDAVKKLNGKFLFNNKNNLPLYLIELNNSGIYISKEKNNDPCQLTVYYSLALRFESKQKAESFLGSIDNTSNHSLSIKEINYENK